MQHHELIIPAFAPQSQKVDIVMVVRRELSLRMFEHMWMAT